MKSPNSAIIHNVDLRVIPGIVIKITTSGKLVPILAISSIKDSFKRSRRSASYANLVIRLSTYESVSTASPELLANYRRYSAKCWARLGPIFFRIAFNIININSVELCCYIKCGCGNFWTMCQYKAPSVLLRKCSISGKVSCNSWWREFLLRTSSSLCP